MTSNSFVTPISAPISAPNIKSLNVTINVPKSNEIEIEGLKKIREDAEARAKDAIHKRYITPYEDYFDNIYDIEKYNSASAEDYNDVWRYDPNHLSGYYNYSSLNLDVDLPNYGVEEYIADRTRFVKGMSTLGNEPGWFYFKVMFKFNTNFGLFGGVLNDEYNIPYFASNCALKYLWEIQHYYKPERPKHRIIALYKFTAMLNKIVNECPWCIKSVGNLSEAFNTYTKDFTKERSFELTFNTENTDMRIGTLLDLYKYICFDDINCKEIVPENLRKFDMSVVFFHVPIKYLQTGIMVAPKKNISTGLFGGKFAKVESIIEKTYNFLSTTSTYYKYKRMSNKGADFSQMLSFKMLTFQNCEFDVESFGKYVEGSELNNEKAFQLGNTAIKIKYDRVYYHNMNEWNEIFFGSTGFEYNRQPLPQSRLYTLIDSDTLINVHKEDSWANRLKSLKEAREGSYFFDENAEQYKSLIDYSEAFITNGLMSMNITDYYSFIKGNIYGPQAKIKSDYFDAKIKILKEGNISGNLYGKKLTPSDNPNGYFEQKMKKLKEGNISGNIYDRIYGVMGSGDNRKNTDYLNKKLEILNENKDLGNLYGKNIGPTSEYSNKKIKSLSHGVLTGNIFSNDGILHKETPNIIDYNHDAGVNVTSNEIDINLAPKSEYNEHGDPDTLTKDIRSNINAAPNDPFTINQQKQRMKEIWNYQLSGSNSSSSVGGAMDAIGDIASFWKW